MNENIRKELEDFFSNNKNAKFCVFKKYYNVVGYSDRELKNVVFCSDDEILSKLSNFKIQEVNEFGHVIKNGEPDSHVADYLSTSIVFGHNSLSGNLYSLMENGSFKMNEFIEAMKNFNRIGVRDFKGEKKEVNQQIIMGEDVFVKQYKLNDGKFELEEMKVASEGDVVQLYNGYYNIPLNNGYTRSIRMVNYKHEEDPSFVPPPKEGFFSKIKKSFK